MKKTTLLIAATIFTTGLLFAADQSHPNPFEKYDKQIKKLEEKQAKIKDNKMKKGVDNEIKKVEEQREKALKKLTAPFEKGKKALTADIEKAKAKDKNADLTVKQAKLDYQDQMIQYYNDLSAGKTPEMPKEPGKEPSKESTKNKATVATDKDTDNKTADSEEK